jgi:hypothetical protein
MMSPEKLNELADAEARSSTAAGAVGVNRLLLEFHRQLRQEPEADNDDERTPTRSSEASEDKRRVA